MSASPLSSPNGEDGPVPSSPRESAIPIAERDLEEDGSAMRIQVAAVAAQQVSLTEEEFRLEQRRVALDRQEEQLAAHLESRNQKLLHFQDKLREERAHFREEQKAWKQQVQLQEAELSQGLDAAREAQAKAVAQRQRSQGLLRKMVKRWRRNWTGEQTRLKTLEQQVNHRQANLDRETERLRQEKEVLLKDRLACNSELELGKRELREGWAVLHQLQRQTEDAQKAQKANLANQQRRLADREAALVWVEHDLAERQRHWDQKRAGLEIEADGLENRIRNLRHQWLDLHKAQDGSTSSANNTASPGTMLPGAVESFLPALVEPAMPRVEPSDTLAFATTGGNHLSRLAEALADQRLVLLEHVTRLLDAWHGCLEERLSLGAELQAAGDRLREREESAALREQALESLAADWDQRQTELHQKRELLEALQIRVQAGESALAKERDALLADVRDRETHVQAQAAVLVKVRRRWAVRRRQELHQLQEELARCQEARRQHVLLLEDNARRAEVLEREGRRIAERALALEEHRLEVLGQSPDSAQAERRIRRLRRRWGKLFAASEQNLAMERRRLEYHASRLDEEAGRLESKAEDLAARETQISGLLARWDHEKAVTEGLVGKLEAEVQSMQTHRHLDQRHREQLEGELERIALFLLHQDDRSPVSAMRAA